jgi:hypothetical protein
MPMAAVTLRPGVDVQQTLTLNSAGVSQSQLIRYKNSLVQAYGGWTGYLNVPSTTRDIHVWADPVNKFASFAGTNSITVYTAPANTVTQITPTSFVSDFTPPNFSITNGSTVVTVFDNNAALSTGNIVYFNTQVAIGNLLLSGAYQIQTVVGAGEYTIVSPTPATVTISNSGILPGFNASSGTASVLVTLPNNNYQSVTGLSYNFIAPTSIAGQTIQGQYGVSLVVDSTQFYINLTLAASVTSSAVMNSNNAELVYYTVGGTLPTPSGFGANAFGQYGFGLGITIPSCLGNYLVASDWTQDNWGEILLSCPENGPIYQWWDDNGLMSAQVVKQAPFFNGGIFVSQPQQILVAWRSVQSTGVQDPLIVRWSNSLDYTVWDVTPQTTAGSFHIPTGSVIQGGIQAPTYGVIWTDIDCWIMQWVGGDVIFNFTRVGSGCGLIGKHAAGTLSGSVYWCGFNNFYTIGGSGVQALPCTVWDYIFQNIDRKNQGKVACGINTSFNEITWFFPSLMGNGENDSYVKVHIEGQEYEWDYGLMPRTAWVDWSILGGPLATDPAGNGWQHETSNTWSGVLHPFFRTGWWAIAEGNELSFVDWIHPDFNWGLYSGTKDATMQITIYAADYPGDPQQVFGPYSVTQATPYINTRIRARLLSIGVQVSNNEFWRLGKVRYRWAPAGRR